MNRFLPFALLTLAAAGCADVLLTDITPEAAGIRLTVNTSPREISPGDTVQIVSTLTNTNSHPVTLHFSSGCQILAHVEKTTGQTVYPSGGWVCAAVLTTLELAAGESHTTVSAWTGQKEVYDHSTGEWTQERLPAGEYGAYATVDAVLSNQRLELRTPRSPITLR